MWETYKISHSTLGNIAQLGMDWNLEAYPLKGKIFNASSKCIIPVIIYGSYIIVGFTYYAIDEPIAMCLPRPSTKQQNKHNWDLY